MVAPMPAHPREPAASAPAVLALPKRLTMGSRGAILLAGLLLLGAHRPCLAGDAPPLPGNHPPGFVTPTPDAVIHLYPGDAPGLIAGAKPETCVNERFANVSVPLLSVYLPQQPTSGRTALIICAGGGYSHLAMCLHVENVVKVLTERGIVVFGLKYRTRYATNNVVADALADGQRAVRLVRSRAVEWGIDPRRIGVQGYSAGAHLCLTLACHFDDGAPGSADPVERVGCRPDFCALMSPWPDNQPISAFPLTTHAPPTFIASARDDTTAPFTFAQAIDTTLTALGVADQFFAVDAGGHAAFHVGMREIPGSHWPETFFPWLVRIGLLH